MRRRIKYSLLKTEYTVTVLYTSNNNNPYKVATLHRFCQIFQRFLFMKVELTLEVTGDDYETALIPGTWSHLWFAGVRECPRWCSIVGATVTVHRFFCILHSNANINKGFYQDVYTILDQDLDQI